MAQAGGNRMSRRLARTAQVVAVVFIAWMWFYAFLLAPRESANNIGDKAWSARSESTCTKAAQARGILADLSKIDPKDPAVVKRKGETVDAATDSLDTMLDSIEADIPSTAKGRALVPEWIKDYRTYITDRRDYARSLRTGVISEFSESQVEGIPISERLGKFARENRMASCQPPSDLQA